MSVWNLNKPDLVTRCVPRQDGGWMIVTKRGLCGSSPTEIPEGAHVVVREGLAMRPGQ